MLDSSNGERENPSGVYERTDEEFGDEDRVDRIQDQNMQMRETIDVVPPVNETIVLGAPRNEANSYEAQKIGANDGSMTALLKHEESENFRTRWNEIQGKFVDEPRSAVQRADALVSEVITQITQMFSDEHSVLEGQWKQGNNVSTEDLRIAFQRYRSFFNRLVV